MSLGLPDGVLGVAWPSIRRTFDLPLSGLGALLVATTTGYLAASTASGALVMRLGVGGLLLASSLVMVASLSTFALAPAFFAILVAGAFAGVGGGAIDAGINAFAATSLSPARTAWLHAFWGLGATLGPLVVTAVLAAGLSWRWGYAVIALVLASMAVVFAITRDAWPAVVSVDAASPRGPTLVDTLRRPVVVAHVAIFFLYTGLEAAAGQWMYSLLTEARAVPAVVAGVWTAVYWGGLCAGRVALASLLRATPIERVLRMTLAIASLAAILIWLGDDSTLAVVGIAALGLSLAPVYPLLVSATPRRVGASHAAHAIGAQVAAAYLGVATLPGVAGVIARTWGLETLGPALTVMACALFLLHEVVMRSPGLSE